jgi:OmcA/MtrC family decaheme c-type cytochrome
MKGRLIGIAAAGATTILLGVGVPTWTSSDRAYYLSDREANYIRPGLVLKILDAEIATNGVIRTRFRVSDPQNQPLDREGIVTPGPIAVSFVVGVIPNGQTQYTSYITRVQTSPITNRSATQATADSGGTFEKLADGEYRYTFRTAAPQGYDRTATHSIGAYSSRNLTEFDLGTQYSDDVFNFLPAGGDVRNVRNVVKTATCNKCHDPLSAHGGARRKVELCVMCHSPQTTDPDTGNTVDLPVMVHKIHMGKNLSSVVAGGKYQIIGFNQTVVDFSGVGFPTDVRNCQACHESGSVSADTPNGPGAWFKPNRAACGACHDNVNFASGVGHANLPQVSDNQCSTCHIPKGELDFDVSILGAHLVPTESASLPGTKFELLRVDDGTAGKRPTVVFSVKDKAGKPIPPAQMTRLALVLAGPTRDYQTVVSEDARQAQTGSDGNSAWTFQQPIPAGTRGSFSIGIEGYRNVTLLPDTAKATVVRDAGLNRVINFSVDGSPLEARRTVVSIAKCNTCHGSLTLHGGNRNQIEQCVLCHNPAATDAAQRPASAGPAQGIDLALMIHRIHTGEELTREFTIFGFGGSRNPFNEVLFPGDRRNCSTCHVNGSENLPLKETLSNVTDPRGFVNPMGPTMAACTGCHDGRPAAAHAVANTNAVGESCSVCHGPNADFAVSRAHAR